MRSNVFYPLTIVYFISWIFIGNFMLLNLFLAILLDSFTDVEEDEENISIQQREEREKKLKDEMLKKEGKS